jgi:hypothetical protein
MSRIRHWGLNVAASVSFALLLLVSALWAQSPLRAAWAVYKTPTRSIAIGVSHSELIAGYARWKRQENWRSVGFCHGSEMPRFLPDRLGPHRFGGMDFFFEGHQGSSDDLCLYVPCWFIVLLAAIMPAGWIVGRRRRTTDASANAILPRPAEWDVAGISPGPARPDDQTIRLDYGNPKPVPILARIAAVALSVILGLVGAVCVLTLLLWVPLAIGRKFSTQDVPRAIAEELIIVGCGMLLLAVSYRVFQRVVRGRK